MSITSISPWTLKYIGHAVGFVQGDAGITFLYLDNDMIRIPPSLSYLTIYNPTLRPSEPFEDDEDAEEQAHILFYTSKDRAVSRDRMLRQVGLGKALVNFAEQFSAGDLCNNVHSQSRRMVMISPEPDFWIHVCIDVAKITVAPAKGAVKSKADKGKMDATPQYDYQDGSVHDGAVRARILRAYERFKLTHGSFALILSSLGKQALELQLERFWTVWAWSWDVEERPDFAENLGPRLHPHFSSLIPLLDDYASNLSPNIEPLLLSREQIIPSSRFTEGRHPSALAAHLSSMIPAPSTGPGPINALAASVETIKAGTPAKTTGSAETMKPATFLGMPSMNVKMDMRKWNWPGYLTFGKGSSTKPSIENLASISVNAENEKVKDGDNALSSIQKEQEQSQIEVPVNSDALHDAIETDSISILQDQAVSIREGDSSSSDQVNGLAVENSLNDLIDIEEPLLAISTISREETPPLTPPLPEFSLTRLNLAPWSNPTDTRRVYIHYLVWNGYMLALLNIQEPADEIDSENKDLQYASEHVMKLFDDIESTIYSLDLRAPNSPPLASTALERDDQFLISTGQYSLTGTPGFTSNSSHLFNAKAILDGNPKLYEVYSRGQNPQHWHVAKRGLGGIGSLSSNRAPSDEAFMEVFRKEASLTDVDNVLFGSVKKSGILDVFGKSSSR